MNPSRTRRKKKKGKGRREERNEGVKEEPIYMHVHINARFAVYYMII